MFYKTSTVRTSYQGRVSNYGIVLVRGGGNSYGRGRGCGFNPTKPKVPVKCEGLGIDTYSIRDARQADNNTKTIEAILNYIRGTFTQGNDLKRDNIRV